MFTLILKIQMLGFLVGGQISILDFDSYIIPRFIILEESFRLIAPTFILKRWSFITGGLQEEFVSVDTISLC